MHHAASISRRILSGALALGLCLSLNTAPVRARSSLSVAFSAPVSAALTGYSLSRLLAVSDDTGLFEAEQAKLSAYLNRFGMTQEQQSSLFARSDASTLLSRLIRDALPQWKLSFLSLPYARTELLSDYRSWQNDNPSCTVEEAVTAVNIGLNYPFYEHTDVVSDPSSLLALVNKYHALPADYAPTVETLGRGYGNGSLRPEAAKQFRAMVDAAKADGVTIRSASAYRSYKAQTTAYRRYLSQSGQARADTYSARPGFSEHQTGLTVDINVASIRADFENTDAYDWLSRHCAEYGFLLRYPEGKESLTGFTFEPWHYRYVGTQVATVCTEQGLTLEEYLARQPVRE
jgi:LAS superfamily LD-carboxypeptidase LdcB